MMRCMWLGIDFAKLGIVGALPLASARLERQVSARENTVELINRSGALDESSGASLLYAVQWRGSYLDAWDDTGHIVSGRVVDGIAENTSLKLDVRSYFAEACGVPLDAAVRVQDPATVLLALLQGAGIQSAALDLASFERARDYYLARDVRVSAICSRQYETTLLDAVNAILDIGCLYAWMDDKFHVALPPERPAGDIRYLQQIKHGDVIGDVAYGANTSERVTGYSVGHLYDGEGKVPAEGGYTKGRDAAPWMASYNATNQYQIADAHSAHVLGALRMRQGMPRRTAVYSVRDNGSIPVLMAGLYMLSPAPWGGNPAYLAGYTRPGDGTIRLDFVEAL